jgi:hypothetical protein
MILLIDIVKSLLYKNLRENFHNLFVKITRILKSLSLLNLLKFRQQTVNLHSGVMRALDRIVASLIKTMKNVMVAKSSIYSAHKIFSKYTSVLIPSWH